VLIEFSQMATAAAAPGIDLVIDEHNLEYELHRRLINVERGLARKAYNALEYAKLRVEEPRAWRRARACLVTSAREKFLVQRHARHTTVSVVPNGIDLSYYDAFTSQRAESDSIVFIGRMHYRPNADAAVYFAQRVLPMVVQERPAATFCIIGKDPPPEVRGLASRNVVVTGEVEDVRGYLGRAAVVVAPIRAGSGTRLKILEALAMRKAVVSTQLAAEGLELRAGEHLLVAEEDRTFARDVLRVMHDEALAARLGAQGRSQVERHYSWPTVLSPLDEIFPTKTQ
jgi:polysaccharide biosynthesis protein PslH